MNSFKIQRLQVTNFRNLRPDIVEFSPGINCIFGSNGNGKTNLLEALFVLTHRKSFRKNTSFPQFLSIDGDNPEVIINSLFQSEETNEKVSYSSKLERNGSIWSMNGKPTKKKVDVETVFINPFDSYSFHNQPAFRRTFIDQHLSIINSEYKRELLKFSQILRQRNALLSMKPKGYVDQIIALDEQFCEKSEYILRQRELFISELNPFCRESFQKVFSQGHELKLSMETNFAKQNKNEIKNFYLKNLQKDGAIGHTHYGVHRDDFVFLFDEKNAFEFCSLGQQKMGYLSLIFAYIELFRYKFKAYPIVLIDDVSGELDSTRWANLVGYLDKQKFQVLITTANEGFRDELDKLATIKQIMVEAGHFQIVQ